jgi:sensor histidine kinase YesM
MLMQIHDFLFSATMRIRVKRHIAFWVLCYAYLVISYPPKGAGSLYGIGTDGVKYFYEMVLVRSFFHLVFQMAFCYPLLYVLMPTFFWKRKYFVFGLSLFILWIAASIFRYLAFTFLYNPIMQHLHLYSNPRSLVFLISFTQTLNGPAFIGFAFILVKFFKDWQQKQEENFTLKQQNAAAELKLLKAQIHPHFLFNTLNNIYSFTLDKSPQAKIIVKQMRAMLQYMIEECGRPLVPLDSELRIINDYFELESVRYGRSLDMQLKISGDYTNKMVSPLLMIPFVENSFKHGVSKMLRNPWIKLFIHADNDVVHFLLINNKPHEEIQSEKGGIGLTNVKKRLELLYPGNYMMKIESTTNIFTVNMRIPLEKT